MTVALAIILMVVHAAWAAVVLVRQNREAMARFHRFSAAVRTIWLIPYFCGLMGEPRWCGEFPRGNEPVRIGGSRSDHAIGPHMIRSRRPDSTASCSASRGTPMRSAWAVVKTPSDSDSRAIAPR